MLLVVIILVIYNVAVGSLKIFSYIQTSLVEDFVNYCCKYQCPSLPLNNLRTILMLLIPLDNPLLYNIIFVVKKIWKKILKLYSKVCIFSKVVLKTFIEFKKFLNYSTENHCCTFPTVHFRYVFD